jgi:hypothetical protein
MPFVPRRTHERILALDRELFAGAPYKNRPHLMRTAMDAWWLANPPGTPEDEGMPVVAHWEGLHVAGRLIVGGMVRILEPAVPRSLLEATALRVSGLELPTRQRVFTYIGGPWVDKAVTVRDATIDLVTPPPNLTREMVQSRQSFEAGHNIPNAQDLNDLLAVMRIGADGQQRLDPAEVLRTYGQSGEGTPQ